MTKCLPDRVDECATFLSDLLTDEEDLYEGVTNGDALDIYLEGVNDAARSAGYSEAEIEAAWEQING